MSQPLRLRALAPLLGLVAALTVATLPGLPATAAEPGAAPTAAAAPAAAPRRAAEPAGAATGFVLGALFTQQPACTGPTEDVSAEPFLDRRSCDLADFMATDVTGTPTAALFAEGETTPFADAPVAAQSTADSYRATLTPTDAWVPGKVRLVVSDSSGPIGETTFFYSALVADVATGTATAPGDPIEVTGTIAEKVGGTVAGREDGVPATFKVAVTAPGRTEPLFTSASQTATSAGAFDVTVPGSATTGLTSPDGLTSLALRVAVVDAAYQDTAATPPPATGSWAASTAGAASHVLRVPADRLTLENSFVSSVGWVKPGEEYPSTITVSNPTTSAASPTVRITAPTGSTIRTAGTTAVDGTSYTWAPGSIAPGESRRLVLVSRASGTRALPTIVWRDLSTTAVLTASGRPRTTSVAHGPKVIPPSATYDTARYGDRPFPIVPVQYTDRTYTADHSGEDLAEKINDPDVEGSTFNLYQEMSLGQLYPEGDVPSAGIESADFDYAPGFEFQETVPGQTCTGTTTSDLPVDVQGTQLYPERITGGVYNLPGQTQFYGADANGSAVVGSVAGVGALQNIDAGCGPTGKLVADAAALADPEIDYSDFDTDKDGVVDFFMVVYAGCGGNGASQIPGCTTAPSDTASYDNIWPHSSSLEGAYTDETTGLPGLVTDDQLKDLEGRPLWYQSNAYDPAKTTTEDQGDALKVFVRVGPYNVNPETAIDQASVISHEYGHSLGLPDFYSTGSRATYGDWNLMATDKSQNMDAYSRQELGWVVPEVLTPGSRGRITDWRSSKHDTGTIVWQRRNGERYTLRDGADGIVHNSQMYVAKLPGRTLLGDDAFTTGDGATPSHLWWSGSGNDFGCPPTGGRNFDLDIPALRSLPAGTPVRLEMKSRWDIEWDFDYGFVLTTTDGGQTYDSHASENGYTTTVAGVPGNANQNACLGTYDNGLTGSSGSYEAGTQAVDRVAGNYPAPGFLADEFDISDLAGAPSGALRLTYSTDPGLARPGWFIDDVKVIATVGGEDRVLYATDFETSGGPDDDAVYNGGCNEDLTTATSCTLGWKYLQAGAASAQDHAYYLEMRDRSGFDFDSHGESDRGAPGFQAGLYLAYTDEAHGYGNVGTDDPPAQSPIDATPTPGSATPNLDDAAFTTAAARSTYSERPNAPHVDNYTDPSSASGNWEFGYDCLGFTVDRLQGANAASADNLVGDVSFDMGTGCGEFDYGYTEEEPAPANTAPTARATATPATARAGQPVQFSGTSSTDAEDPRGLDYSWSFGDGGSTKDAAGPTPRHAFADPGTYAVRLLVTDPQGLTSTDRVRVTVADGPAGGDTRAPVVRTAVRPRPAVAQQETTLSAARSSDDVTPSSGLRYRWNFFDGRPKVDARTATVQRTFHNPGLKRAAVTVTDAAGNSTRKVLRVRVVRFVGCGAPSVVERGVWRERESGRTTARVYCDSSGSGRGPDTVTTFATGGRFGVVYGQARQGGRAAVLVDGRRVDTLRFAGPRRRVDFGHRQFVSGLGTGRHSVTVRLLGGEGWLEGFVRFD